ncbi:PAS domain-containing sensor histidine kinase [Lentisalinibacter sediminis]|uniref:PAS domain-containing sensor histidine kinase n=1 Tax=Lentisalinibacter sediminis TaxID=2992237 RepID=UPI0038659D60
MVHIIRRLTRRRPAGFSPALWFAALATAPPAVAAAPSGPALTQWLPWLVAGVALFLLGFVLWQGRRRGLLASVQLEDSQKLMHSVVETAAEAIITMGVDGRIRTFNRAAEAMFGYTRDEIIGEDVSTLMPTPHAQRHHRYVAHYMETGEARIIGIGRYVEAKRRDGSIFPVHLAISEFQDGEKIFTGILRDMTQVRELESALRDKEKSLKMALRAANLNVWEWEPVTDAFRTLEGDSVVMPGLATGESIHGADLRHRVLPEDRSRIERAIGRVHEGDSQAFEYRVKQDDGTLRWFRSHTTPVFGPDHRVERVLGVTRDITESKEREAELASQRERLTHVARLSTMGEMAAGIAHEINQPLTAITTYAQGSKRMIAAGNPDTAKLTRALGNISDQALRAGEVIRRLRALIRKTDQTREVRNINELISELEPLVSIDVRGNDIPVIYDFDQPQIPVKVDPVQIQQVMLNLLRNAFDASEERRTGDIVVQTRLNGDDEVMVRVTDHGTGMSEEVKSNVSNPFFTTKKNGMGLGVSICMSIIRSHGGEVTYEDNPKGGTIVTLTLPTVEGGVRDGGNS